jgi:hypothetical protein
VVSSWVRYSDGTGCNEERAQVKHILGRRSRFELWQLQIDVLRSHKVGTVRWGWRRFGDALHVQHGRCSLSGTVKGALDLLTSLLFMQLKQGASETARRMPRFGLILSMFPSREEFNEGFHFAIFGGHVKFTDSKQPKNLRGSLGDFCIAGAKRGAQLGFRIGALLKRFRSRKPFLEVDTSEFLDQRCRGSEPGV